MSVGLELGQRMTLLYNFLFDYIVLFIDIAILVEIYRPRFFFESIALVCRIVLHHWSNCRLQIPVNANQNGVLHRGIGDDIGGVRDKS